MRFFFEFVSCCGSPTLRVSERKVLTEDEERSLVPVAVAVASSRRICRKKQRRIGASDWKPSLGSISEDNALPSRERNGSRNGAVASVGSDAKKRSAAVDAGAAKARQRSYRDGYHGSAAMPTVMPAFSPTPFMF